MVTLHCTTRSQQSRETREVNRRNSDRQLVPARDLLFAELHVMSLQELPKHPAMRLSLTAGCDNGSQDRVAAGFILALPETDSAWRASHPDHRTIDCLSESVHRKILTNDMLLFRRIVVADNKYILVYEIDRSTRSIQTDGI